MAEVLNKLVTVGRTVAQPDVGLKRVQRYGTDLTFSEVLRSRIEKESGVSFSSHALERLGERNIDLSPEQLGRLSDAVGKAEEKGSRDSLVVIDDIACIVSIENRTVITALGGDSVKDHVFTNIDSTVFA